MNQFSYIRHKDLTIFVDTPDRKDLENMFTSHSNQILLPVGISKRNPKEQHNKKIAREWALKNTQFIILNLDSIEQKGTKHLYNFTTKLEHANRSLSLGLTFTTVAESNVVRFINSQYINIESSDLFSGWSDE